MERSLSAAGLVVAVEMFAVFEGWGRPDEIYGGLKFKVCRYDRYGRRVFVIRSGPGQENAEEAACLLVEKFGVQELWNFGVVGGLTPGALVGDVFVVDEVVRWDADGAKRGRRGGCGGVTDGAKRGRWCSGHVDCGSCPDVIYVDMAVGAAAAICSDGVQAIRRARAASGNSVISARRARESLASFTGADIVDMEAAGIAAASVEYKLPCFITKCVSDDLYTDESMLTDNFRKTACTAFAVFDIILRNS